MMKLAVAVLHAWAQAFMFCACHNVIHHHPDIIPHVTFTYYLFNLFPFFGKIIVLLLMVIYVASY